MSQSLSPAFRTIAESSLVTDIEETVIVKTLATITTLTDRRLLTKGRTWEIVSQVIGFLCHPNIWIREGEQPVEAIQYQILTEMTASQVLQHSSRTRRGA